MSELFQRAMDNRGKLAPTKQRLRAPMNHKLGIWIDHKKAVIVWVSTGGVTSKTLESKVGSHGRFSSPQEGGGEKKYEDRCGEHLDQYSGRSQAATQGASQPPFGIIDIFGDRECSITMMVRR